MNPLFDGIGPLPARQAFCSFLCSRRKLQFKAFRAFDQFTSYILSLAEV